MRRDDTIVDQLMELKALTELIGTIYEAQIFQLKAWAAMIFDNNAEVKVGTEPPEVIFKSDIKADTYILEGLDRSVKYVLGDYFTTSVFCGDEQVFNSPGGPKPKKYRNE
ncbi:MAG TPA: hypothetical protein VHD33_00270 [Legionellaceae bacterium]|nr:hypothetical protein [Legionellaceae bacterium]